MLNLRVRTQDVHAALTELRELVLLVCDKNLSDPRFGLYSRLLEENPDLRDRYLRKLHGYAEQLAADADHNVDRRSGSDARKLRNEVTAPLSELDTLTTSPNTQSRTASTGKPYLARPPDVG